MYTDNNKQNYKTMKTTTTAVLEKRIGKLVKAKRLSKNSLVYKTLVALETGELVRPVYSQGSTWKHSSLVDFTVGLRAALDLMGVEYEVGNDAPKGGKTGAYVKVTTKIKQS